jgi:hypothetical protein
VAALGGTSPRIAPRDGDKRRWFGDDGRMARLGARGKDGAVSLAFIPLRRDVLANARSLACVELEGGPLAFRTELIDIPVSPGARLWLVAEDARVAAGEPDETPVVVWGEPALSGELQELNLLELDAPADDPSVAAGITRHRAPSSRVVLLGGRPIDNAFITPVSSGIGWSVPEGYTRLVVECGFDGSALPSDPGVRVRCVVLIFGETPAVDAP